MLPEDTSPRQTAKLSSVASGQQLHVSGVFIVLLELALVVENLLPILVVVVWLPVHARGVGDRLIAAFSATCILSALVPTPLGLASYFSGGWYGGPATCTTYQVTSIWCNLSSLALLTYMCVNCHCAVWRISKSKPLDHRQHRRLPTLRQSSPHSMSSCSPRSSHAERAGQKYAPFQAKKPTEIFLTDQPGSVATNSSNVDDISSISRQESKDKGKGKCKHFDDDNDGDDGSDGAFHQLLVEPNSDSVLSGPPVKVETLGNTISGHSEVIQLSQKQENESITHPIGHHMANGFGQISTAHKDSHTEINNIKSITTTELCQGSRSSCAGNHDDTLSCKEHSHSTTENHMNRKTQELFIEARYGHGCCKMKSNIGNFDSEINSRSGGNGDSWLCSRSCQTRDYVSLMLFLLYTSTLVISSLPVVGFGPRPVHSETMCRSWLVPIPTVVKERTFFVVFLFFVYLCLVVGCASGVSVCMQVSRRMKQERKRRSRLYHEEQGVPDIVELSMLDDMKRQYSLTCIVMAGLLTWLPIVMMLTLQKTEVPVSEATLMYSNIATSLPGLLNPLLYSLALAKYRAGYKSVLEKCCCKRRHKQNNRHLGEVRVCEMSGEGDMNQETVVASSVDGHTCLHGTTNPSFAGHSQFSVEVGGEEDDDDDDEEEEEDEDYFPDDSELLEEGKKESESKMSEKTPLQAMTVTAAAAGAFRTVIATRAKSPWQRHQHTHSSCNDEECLLGSSTVFVNEETGL